MKADMRAPVDGGKDYLLYVEAETDLERSVLAHFVERRTDDRELRIIHAVSGHGSAGNVEKVFMAWGERKAYAPSPSADIGQRPHCGVVRCEEFALADSPYCAEHRAFEAVTHG